MSAALEQVTGCVKTYLMQFSEAEGFSHLHLHLVPRLAGHPAAALGPAVFSLMAADESRWLPAAQRDDVAVALRAAYAEV
jgi:diadenosine tetraphosphate (Ap4A) HIT family hydrolase